MGKSTRTSHTASLSDPHGKGSEASTEQQTDAASGIFDARALDVAIMAVGLSAWYLCSNWVSTLTYDMTVHHWWLNRSGAEIAAIAIALLVFGKIDNAPKVRILDWVLALGYLGALIVLALPIGNDPLWATIALALFGLGQIWMMARWSRRLACATTSRLLAALLAAIALIALAKIPLAAVPRDVASGVVSLLPLLASAMLVFHRQDAPAPARRWFNLASARSYAPLAFAMAAFFLVWSVLNFILKRETGHYSVGESSSLMFTVVAQALTIVLAAFIAWWVFDRHRKLDVTMVWKFAYTLMAAALFLFVLFGTTQFIQTATGAAVVIAKMFLWLALINVARHSDLAPWSVVCAGQLLYAVPDCLGRALASGLSLSSLENTAAAALLLGIVIVVAFCLPDRSPAAMNLLSDLNGTSEPSPTESQALESRCHAVGQAHGLSKREIEILEFLCKGRSRPYIAETLYLSENTVRTHSKHIYQKLDVHTRQELLDLVSGA